MELAIKKNKQLKITIIAGARPNFIKIAPIIHEINAQKKIGADIDFRLIHTGQHYDMNMSNSFFKELDIPNPHSNLSCSGGSQAELTAKIMVEFEKELIQNECDIVLVVGDVTSTMACTIVAKKLNVRVAHVEAGIRSDDWSMPEEINRLVTDSITDYFFTTSKTANQNLVRAGVNKKNIFFVGNTMIDTLNANIKRFSKPDCWQSFNLVKKKYLVITLHRPANVDEQVKLKDILEEIINNSEDLPLIFPVHPRTKKSLENLNIFDKRLHLVPPLSYLQFNYLVKNSKAVITDSGGITEETTVLGVPCITIRDNTERPETVILGTNELIGTDPSAISLIMKKLFSGKWKKGSIPELWDGKASFRIVKKLLKINIYEE